MLQKLFRSHSKDKSWLNLSFMVVDEKMYGVW